METLTNPTAQKLFRAFSQFSRIGWHEHTIAGCKPSEIRVLFCIKKGVNLATPEMKVSEISRLLQVTSPTVTQLLKGLETNGLIERNIDSTDRRAVGIKLTAKGELITQEAACTFAASLNGLMDYLGEDQSNQLAELLFKVFRYYSEKPIKVNSSPWSGEEET